MTKPSKVVAIILPAIVIIAGSIFVFYTLNPTACPLPDYSASSGYPQDLLILEGSCVVPTAIEAIQDRTLPKRPFVMDFLGNGAYDEALEPLVKMAADETEPHRAVAIIAVFKINNEKGRELARRYEAENGELGKISRDILANKDYLHARKGYWQAWRSYIDMTYAL